MGSQQKPPFTGGFFVLFNFFKNLFGTNIGSIGINAKSWGLGINFR